MMWLFTPLLVLALFHYVVAVRKSGILTANSLFVATQLLMVLGTLRLVDPDSPVDVFYAELITAAVAVYIIASTITYLVRAPGQADDRRSYAVSAVAPNRTMVVVIVVSIAVVVAYLVAVGYSAFALGVQGLINGQPTDISTLRLESYAGTRYLFPGYVNQFRNVVLPSLAVLVATWAFSRRATSGRIVAVVLLSLSALSLLSTGQRGAFVAFLLTTVVYLYLYNRHRLPRAALWVPFLGLPLVMLSTLVLARRAPSSDGPLLASLTDLYQRFINDNQQSGIAAFRYTSQRPSQAGQEWMQGLAGVLPGNRGSTLSSEVFATLYGSPRGTSPPSLWGSIHYNVDTLGVLVCAAALGILFQVLALRSLRADSYNSLQLIGLSGVIVVLGTWIAAGPDGLLNTGLVAYIALWYWGGRIRTAPSPATSTQRTLAPGPRLAPARDHPRTGAAIGSK